MHNADTVYIWTIQRTAASQLLMHDMIAKRHIEIHCIIYIILLKQFRMSKNHPNVKVDIRRSCDHTNTENFRCAPVT